ncbi:NADH dehydrogenase [ubiquinone] iron-sulfur protein 1, mitochondrial [Tanacetum coccineum]
MGLGLLASRTLRSIQSSPSPKTQFILRTIVSTPELHKPEAEPVSAPEPIIPPRKPIAGARLHIPNPEDVIEVFVDGYPVKIPKGMTVLQACSVAGVDIPRFCYHDRLSIAGNCRMCLVEVEKSPKPVASCAMPALPGQRKIVSFTANAGEQVNGKGQETTSCTLVEVKTVSFSSSSITIGVSVLAISSREYSTYFLWHPRFEPFVSYVVVNVAEVVVIGAAVVVIGAAVVVESLVGLAKVRYYRLMAKAKKPKLVSGSRRNRRMKIKTDTPIAKKAREGVMEFLLMNHPLDCPICDQGGECDLQDQSMAFGSDRGRFTETKRSVVDKNLGPLVKTVMTRCIQCTRCVRFASEIAGVQDLGMLGRGSGEEIGTYVEKLMTSELSGNVIDICPVGALTSKPFAFKARNWELKGTESIDVTDAVGSNIRIDSRGPEVMRIVPRLNEFPFDLTQDINEEWISDKTRFCYDGLKRQRLNDPMIRGADGRFQPVSWRDALAVVDEVIRQVKPEEIVGVAGKLSDAESMILLKDFLNKLGSNNIWCEGNGKNTNADLRSGYLLNSSIQGLEKADCFLLVGTQPRVEAAMVNARIRKTVRATQAKVGYIGAPADFNYDHEHLGTGPETLVEIAEGRHSFSSALSNAKNPAIIIGAGIFEREDKDAIFSVIQSLAAKHENLIRPDWNGVNVLLLNAAQAAALDLGLVPESDNSIESAKFLYLMGADDVNLDKLPKDAFVVYQGHHGDKGVYRANVILPAAAFSEKEGTYVNTEGCAQQTVPAVPTVGDAREDWKIIRALSEVSGVSLPYDTISGVRSRIRTVAPNLLHVDEREPATFSTSLKPERTSKVSATPFGVTVDNFYMTDAITRASKIMAQCSALLKNFSEEKEIKEKICISCDAIAISRVYASHNWQL